VSVRCKLNAIGKARGQILGEEVRVLGITLADHVARDQLGIGANRGPGPYVTNAVNAFQIGRDVLFLGVAERPDFIALDALARQVAQCAILEVRTSRANVYEQLGNGVDALPCDPRYRPETVALDEQAQDLCAVLQA